jgi:transketolase
MAINKNKIKQISNAIKFLSVYAVKAAKSGHIGLPLGMADVAATLFANHLNFNPDHPDWINRDKFILSAGHGSMLLYSLLYLMKYPGITIKDIKNFRQLRSKCAGHPEYGLIPGIETTTGPLGQGFANAVGMAISNKKLQHNLGNQVINSTIYVIASDGDLMEGISYEAAALAGHLSLDNLIVLWDNNKVTIDGDTDLTRTENMKKRFNASNWDYIKANGHKINSINKVVEKAKKSKKPVLIDCKTIIGKGLKSVEGTEKAHGSNVTDEDIKELRKRLNWNNDPFDIPKQIFQICDEIIINNQNTYNNWKQKNKNTKLNKITNISKPLQKIKNEFLKSNDKLATRKSFGKIIDGLHNKLPIIIGSADLSASNNTKSSRAKKLQKHNWSGKYLHYGIREHGMAGIMNGIALSDVYTPIGGTFLTFSDYMRPAIRLSALMNQHVIYVLTHDSIGLGEDGPTHQPIEHLMALRNIPNLYVFRPCDTIEVAECFEIAWHMKKPAVLALSRQKLSRLRKSAEENKSKNGAYVISDNSNKKATKNIITLYATGSEVSLALETQKELQKQKVPSKVVSIPCFKLFDEQSNKYKQKILDKNSYKVSIEAGSTLGWKKYVDLSIGINEFGHSAPGEDLFEYFKFQVAKITKKILKKQIAEFVIP